LFGSDVPNTPLRVEDALAVIRSLGLAPEHEAAFLGGNAARLLAAPC